MVERESEEWTRIDIHIPRLAGRNDLLPKES